MKEDRSLSKIRKLFKNSKDALPILLSPSDMGVRRNLGKNGSRYAPNVILEQFKNMTFHNEKLEFKEVITSSQQLEKDDFACAQSNEIEQINSANLQDKVLHLGGGHDHIYPLLMALQASHKNILVINIDAHYDTRVDSTPHSGNPFRLFDLNKDSDVSFEIIQFGVHSYSNSPETTKPLTNSEMVAIEDPNDLESLFKEIKKRHSGNKIVLSLDCDGLDSSIMSAVSAVNHHGTTATEIIKIVDYVKSISENSVFGIYEYNPIFDDINVKSAKFIAKLIHQYYF